eukprot:1136786-Pelagomonas_calceolata.AAC.4
MVRKEKTTPAKRPRALRRGSLTSKLGRVSRKGPQTYTRRSLPRRKPETELMRIWRVGCHAPERRGSPSPPLLDCTKTASGQLWCRAEEPAPLGKLQWGLTFSQE